MTATPTASSFSNKYGDFIRKAGSKFGLGDLTSLFADEEGEGTGSLEGFAPSFKVQTLLKGRPSSLTYTTPRTQTRIAEFSLTPEGSGSTVGSVTDTTSGGVVGGGTTGGAAMEPEPEPVEEKAKKLLSEFIGPMGTSGSIGAMGVGRAQEYGYSNEDIKRMAQEEGLTFGEQAAKGLGIQTTMPSYTGSGATSGALGMAAVDRARQAGLADEAIRSLAQQQGLTFGTQAAQALNVGPSMTYQAPAPAAAAPTEAKGIAAFAKDSGSGGIGLAGLQRAAEAKGISLEQAARRAEKQGLTLGGAARKYL
jgi:hypothetical protein